jgi:hypothetical protein
MIHHMEKTSAVLGAAGMLLVGGLAFGLVGIANADNEPAPTPTTVATVAPSVTPTPEPVVTEPVVEPAAVEPAAEAPAPVVAEPVVVAPEPAPVVVEPAPVYVAPAPVTDAGQVSSYSKPTAPPDNGPDPIKNTGKYDQPVTGELYLNPADVPK